MKISEWKLVFHEKSFTLSLASIMRFKANLEMVLFLGSFIVGVGKRSLQNRRYLFCVFPGERGQARGEREVRDTRDRSIDRSFAVCAPR